MWPHSTTRKRRSNKITDLSLPILKKFKAMHALAHQLNCNFGTHLKTPPQTFFCQMPTSRKTKRKVATGESSRQDPSSSSLSLDDTDKGEAKERSAKKYHSKCQIENDVVLATAKRALKAKAKNGGRMPYKWYTNYVSELKQSPVGCHMIIATEDIRNRVRALEMAAAADLVLMPRVTRRVSPVPPSGGPSILTGDSAERQPNAASTTASIVSQVSAQVEDSM